MSNKKGLENKVKWGILTRQMTQRNPELKKQVDEINKETNILERKPRVTRSPPRTQLNKFSTHTYVNVPLDSKTEENTEKISIPTTSKADLNVLEKSDSNVDIRTIEKFIQTIRKSYILRPITYIRDIGNQNNKSKNQMKRYYNLQPI